MPEPDTLTIHLLCLHDKDREAYEQAAARLGLPSFVKITTHSCSLAALPSSVRFDAVVSPANSYGRLDGAFDDAISRALSPRDDYLALTRAAQAVLYREHRGWANPGSCTVVPVPADFAQRSRNVWGATHLLLCPTMRVPENVVWDKEVIYQCVWSLLCAVDKHNQAVAPVEAAAEGAGDANADDNGAGTGKIGSLLMTPLATGIGKVSEKVWAAQLVTALKHFDLAVRNPEEFASLDVERILSLDGDIQATYPQHLG